MKWMRLFVGFTRDPKIKELSRSERLFYLELCMWSTEQDTDGRIPTSALSVIGDGHKGKHQSLQKMAQKGLLSHSTCGDEYTITAWPKWQMNTHNVAGQGRGSDGASRAGAIARTKNRSERSSINRTSSTLAPTQVRPDEAMAALQLRNDACSHCGMVNGNHLADCSSIAKKGSDDDGKADQHGSEAKPDACSSPAQHHQQRP